jgi:ketosteroid isomerase-like protein
MKKSKHVQLFLLLIFCVLMTAQSLAQSTDSVKIKEVIARQAAFASTIMQINWNELANFLSDDLVYVHSFGRVDSKADLLKNIARFKACKLWENKDIKVRLHKHIAIVHSNMFTTLTLPDGTETVSQQRATDIWVKQKGNWLLLAHQSTTFK